MAHNKNKKNKDVKHPASNKNSSKSEKNKETGENQQDNKSYQGEDPVYTPYHDVQGKNFSN
ncbi:MAG: hypothetical protein AABY64_10100 [Bdellovibrionota bacterium]